MVHDRVDAPLDVGHLLQHLADGGLVTLQTHVLRVLGEEERVGQCQSGGSVSYTVELQTPACRTAVAPEE